MYLGRYEQSGPQIGSRSADVLTSISIQYLLLVLRVMELREQGFLCRCSAYGLCKKRTWRLLPINGFNMMETASEPEK